MPLIQSSASVGATSTTEDLLVNNVLAIPPGNALVELALVASAAGLLIDVNVGTRQIAPSIKPSIQNRVPVYPEDFTITFGVLAGERIIIKAQNPTGGAITIYYTLKLNPR